MPTYAFQVTARHTLADKLRKGASVLVERPIPVTPAPAQIQAAYEEQLGIALGAVRMNYQDFRFLVTRFSF